MNKKEKEAGVLSLSHKGNKSDSIEELYVSRENKKNDKFSKLPLKINTARFVKGIKGTDEFLENDILQIAFFGRSNAGKSSTINALLGRNTLVKSSSTPGKTKEINLFEVNDTFHIVDLPGYGYAKISQTERESLRKLIEWYIFDCPVKNRVNVLVLDGKVGLTEMDHNILDAFGQLKEKTFVLMNKTDRLKQKDLSKNYKKLKETIGSRAEVIIFSATKKTGVSEFWKNFQQDEEENEVFNN